MVKFGRFKKWHKFVPLLLIFSIFLASFPIIPFLDEPFTYLKYVGVSLSLFLFSFWLISKQIIRIHYFHYLILIFIFYAISSIFWSYSLYRYLRELFIYLIPFIIIFISTFVKKKAYYNKIIIFLLFTSIFYGIYGIFQFFHIDFPFFRENIGRYRIVGWFGNPIYFTEFLLPLFIFSFALFLGLSSNKRFKWWSFLSFITAGFTLIVSLSRGAWVGMFFGIIFIFFILFWKNKKALLVFSLLFLLLFISIFLSSSYLKGRFLSIFNPYESSIYRRFMIWLISFEMIKDHPFFGVGIGNFRYFFPSYQAVFFYRGPGRELGYPRGVAFKTHNDYIQIFSELGVLGFVLFISILFFFFLVHFKNLNKRDEFYIYRIAFLSGVVSMLFEMLTGFSLRLPHSAFLFWFFMGMSLIGIDFEKNQLKIWLFLKWIILFIMLFNFAFSVHNFFSELYTRQGEIAYLEHKDFKKAKILLAMAEKVMPIKGEPCFYMGAIDFKTGNIKEGIKEMEKAKKNFDHAEIHASLGYYYLLEKKYKKAIDEYQKAIMYKKQKDPHYKVKYLTDIGLCYKHLGDFKKAEAYYKEALSIDPEFVNAIYNLGVLYDTMGRKDLALFQFKRLWNVIRKDGITHDELLILKRVQKLGYLKLKIE